jgi:hypothetical protein
MLLALLIITAILLFGIVALFFIKKNETYIYLSDSTDENFLSVIEIPSDKQSTFPLSFFPNSQSNNLKDTEIVYLPYSISNKTRNECLRDNAIRLKLEKVSNKDEYLGRIVAITPYGIQGYLCIDRDMRLIWTSRKDTSAIFKLFIDDLVSSNDKMKKYKAQLYYNDSCINIREYTSDKMISSSSLMVTKMKDPVDESDVFAKTSSI